ncbi:MAG: Na+/H+ antiporter NhaA, partial [Bifidobacteriaceae bacterium]|nr:Na+/H+ antiporter NhaA [Bifidobacteriaceae bacterium]
MKIKKLEQFANTGYLLIAAAVLGLLISNLPTYQGFQNISNAIIQIPFLHISIENFVEEGLLAIFFLNVGLDLKHEFIFGPFNNPKKAGLPIIAAAGGVILPASIFAIIIFATSNYDLLSGWAIPAVTDIALSLAVLSFATPKIKRNEKSHIRTFLMTLAVADDIFGIMIIALFYSHTLNLPNLLFSLTGVVIWSAFTRFDAKGKWFILIPIAILSWYFMLESGVHTAIIGVLLGFTVNSAPKKGNWKSRIVKYENLTALFSGLFVLPIYIFFKMKINFSEIFNNILNGQNGQQLSILIIAVFTGLVIGKPLGIICFTKFTNRFTSFSLEKSITNADLYSIGFLAGIGFTVSFLIADLSYLAAITISAARLGIIIGSLISAIVGFLIFRKKAP